MASTQDKLRVLHQAIDEKVSVLETKHAAFMQCKRGCCDCCQDELTVFEVEASQIRTFLKQTNPNLELHPAGSCAFLHPKDKSCQIYQARPYVCRTQGLPLRFLEETDDGLAEFRDICPLNDTPTTPIEELDPQDCWEIGPTESELWVLATEESVEDPVAGRVGLRSLAIEALEE